MIYITHFIFILIYIIGPNETKLYITEITEEGFYLDHLDLYNVLEITDKIKGRTFVKGKEMRTAKQIICLAKIPP